MGMHTLIKGQHAIIITSLAEELIKEGICEENNSVTLRESIVELKGNEIGQIVLDELPDHATDIVNIIPSLINKYALKELATDDRVTVSNAAKERLDELN